MQQKQILTRDILIKFPSWWAFSPSVYT